MYKKIIVPLDGSELAECVLPHVESIAINLGTEEVILITVTELVASLVKKHETGISNANYEEFQPIVAFADRPYSGRSFEINPSLKINLVTGKILKQGQRYLTKVAENLLKTGVKTSITILMGDTAEQIVDFAGSEKADLIIMASHGRSGFNRWAVGSVAEKVFHGSSVPIFLVKAAPKEMLT